MPKKTPKRHSVQLVDQNGRNYRYDLSGCNSAKQALNNCLYSIRSECLDKNEPEPEMVHINVREVAQPDGYGGKHTTAHQTNPS